MPRFVAFSSPDPCQGYNLHPCSDVYLGADVLLKFGEMQSVFLKPPRRLVPRAPSLSEINERMHMMALFSSARPHMYTFETHVWGGWESGENQTFGYEVTWQGAS